MTLLISARALAASNLHPEDEPGFLDHHNLFRPPYALETNARNIDLARFTCLDAGDNIITNISKHPNVKDINGYVVLISSFEEIKNGTNPRDDDPSECKSVVFNYWHIPPMKRYRAIPLTRDSIINAIRIFVENYSPTEGVSIDTLLKKYFTLFEENLPETSKASDNLNFIRNCMAPLLEQGSELPCWERDNMIVLLEFSRDDPTFDDFIIRCENGLEPDMPEGIILDRAFILRWIFNNFPHISKIITHKTDGAHRDFAYDVLYTGSFGSFEGDTARQLTDQFSENPHPISTMINVQYSLLPVELRPDFVQTQKKISLDSQKCVGLDKALDLLDIASQLKHGLMRIHSDDNFLDNELVQLNMASMNSIERLLAVWLNLN